MGRKRTGSLYQRKGGTWRVAFTFPEGRWDRQVEHPDGLPVTEEYAEQVFAEISAAVASRWNPYREEEGESILPGPTPDRTPLTLWGYTSRWIDRQGYSEAPYHKRHLELYLQPDPIARLPLPSVRPRHCLAYVERLKKRKGVHVDQLAPRTVILIAGIVKRSLDQARRDEIIRASPWDLPPGALPSVEDKDPGARRGWIYTPREATLIYTAPEIPLYRRALYAVCFFTGCRVGEAVALRLGDYQRQRTPLGGLWITKTRCARDGSIHRTKTRVDRLVPVHPTLAALLAEWLLSGLPARLRRPARDDDLLFPSPQKGGEWTQSGLRGALQEDLLRLGLRPRRQHSARRTHISLLTEGGARREVFRRWTHGEGKQDGVLDDYTTLQWETLCREILLLPLPDRSTEAEVVRLASGGGNATDNATEDKDKDRKSLPGGGISHTEPLTVLHTRSPNKGGPCPSASGKGETL